MVITHPHTAHPHTPRHAPKCYSLLRGRMAAGATTDGRNRQRGDRGDRRPRGRERTVGGSDHGGERPGGEANKGRKRLLRRPYRRYCRCCSTPHSPCLRIRGALCYLYPPLCPHLFLPSFPHFALLHTPTGESGHHVTQKEDAVGTAKPLAGAPRLVVRCSAHQPRPATSGSTPTDGRANVARLPLALAGRGSTLGSMPPAAGDQQEHPDWWPRL